LKVFIKSKCCY